MQHVHTVILAPRPVDILFIPCNMFGGGWLVARTLYGASALRELYCGEDPVELAPLEGEAGYIVEPRDIYDAHLFLQRFGAVVES